MFNRSVILQTLLSFGPLDLTPDLKTPNTTRDAPVSPICYGVYGCFPLDGVWFGDERPVAVAPQPPHEVDVHICLHTKQQPYCHVLDVEDFSSIQNAGLNSSSHLYVIVHGFVESRNIPWISYMTKGLLDLDHKPSVISVGWGKGAQPPYSQAVGNTRIVGNIIGYLLHILVEYFDQDPSMMHLVGHSLGSHIMGYAGSYFQKIHGNKVSRITGLDPAGPYFVNTQAEVRLDPTDADFVEVIHTDETNFFLGLPMSMGLPTAIGHVDYYPNGGVTQIGCEGSVSSKANAMGSYAEGVIAFIGCNHQRSVEYFIEAVSKKCEYVGVACASWNDYLHGRCWNCSNTESCYTLVQSNPALKQIELPYDTGLNENSHLTILEMEEKNTILQKELNDSSIQNYTHKSTQKLPVNVKVFFGTNPESPFCAEQYLVTVMSPSSVQNMEGGGAWARLDITIMGTLNNVHINPPEEPDWLTSGGVARWVGFGRPLGKLRFVRVTFKEDPGLLGLFIPRLNYNTLFLERIFIDELSTGKRIDLFVCSQEIKAGELRVLYHNRTC